MNQKSKPKPKNQIFYYKVSLVMLKKYTNNKKKFYKLLMCYGESKLSRYGSLAADWAVKKE